MRVAALRYLISVSEYGSMSAAALVLGVSESALSQGIGQLEHELGCAVFFRNGRRLCLTPAGSRALVRARRLVNRFSQLQETVGQNPSVGSRLDILVEPALATDPTVGLVSEVRRRLPTIEIRVRSAEGIIDAGQSLREGLSQFAIVYSVRPHPELASLLLGQHVLCVVYPPGSDVDENERFALTALEGIRMVGVPRGAAQREFLDEKLARSGVRTQMIVETDNRAQLVPLVLSGVGATIVPEGKAFEAAMRGAIVRTLSPEIGRGYELVWMRDEMTAEMEIVICIAKELAVKSGIASERVTDVS